MHSGHPSPAYKTDARRAVYTVECFRFGSIRLRHLRTARHKKLIEEVVRARNATGMSQRVLAARLKRSPSYVSKFEAAERKLEVCEFVDLCDALGVDPCELLGRILRR